MSGSVQIPGAVLLLVCYPQAALRSSSLARQNSKNLDGGHCRRSSIHQLNWLSQVLLVLWAFFKDKVVLEGGGGDGWMDGWMDG